MIHVLKDTKAQPGLFFDMIDYSIYAGDVMRREFKNV